MTYSNAFANLTTENRRSLVRGMNPICIKLFLDRIYRIYLDLVEIRQCLVSTERPHIYNENSSTIKLRIVFHKIKRYPPGERAMCVHISL